ncbi:MAG: hypothetical protein FK734_06950 [Asgard group archaeon]|nr:hypothetical protein [Asgard group archaeon]
MSKKTMILMMTSMAVIALISFSPILTSAATRGWNPGDIIIWGWREDVENTTLDNEEGVAYSSTTTSGGDEEYNITAINILDKEYDAYLTSTMGSTFLNDRTYDPEDFVSAELDIFDFIDEINYYWDYEQNQSVLALFSTNIDPWYLIDPDWAVINEGFVDMLNGTILLDTLNDPYEPIVYNYTLADVLGSFSIKIMGKNSLNNSLSQFTDNKNKWTFEFDLTGTMYYRYYNGSMWIYQIFDKYIESWEISYSDDGILNEVKYTLEYQRTIDDIIVGFNYVYYFTIGGMKSAAANFATYSAIAGLLCLGTLVTIIRKKKR